MISRRTMVGLGVIATAVAAIVAIVIRNDPEPTHAGKPASHWLDELVASRGASEEAKEAFRAMSAKAVPYLIEELTRKSELRERLAKDSSWLSYRVLRTAPQGVLKRVDWRRREFAALALGEIGSAAKPAIPALINALTTEESIEFDRAAKPNVDRTFIRDTKATAQAISALGKIGMDSEPVVIALIEVIPNTSTGGPELSGPVAGRGCFASDWAGVIGGWARIACAPH